MTLLSISLLVFSVIILFTTILLVIWWKKYGKTLFLTIKDLKNMQNPQNFMENMRNLGNLEDFLTIDLQHGDYTYRKNFDELLNPNDF